MVKAKIPAGVLLCFLASVYGYAQTPSIRSQSSDPTEPLVEILVNASPETNVTVQADEQAVVRILSRIPDSPVFYTLDGSAPSPAARVYDGPFELATNAVVRAAAYDTEFEAHEAAAIQVSIENSASLRLKSHGAGEIEASPERAVYALGEEVELTANADPYHRFLRWSDGDDAQRRTVRIGLSNEYTAIFTNAVPVEEHFYRVWERRIPTWGRDYPKEA